MGGVDETLRTWGTNIRQVRKALGFTQERLADLVGVKHPTVCRWEKGQIEPRRQHKAAIAKALHVDMNLLFPQMRAE